MIEVELKFALPTDIFVPLQARLDALPSLRRLMPVENVDIYYDTLDFSCFRQAVFLRIRDFTRLEIKYHEQDDPTHTHATEQSFSLTGDVSRDFHTLCSRFIPSWQIADTVEDALALNQLHTFVHIEKRRTRYVNEQLNLCLDQVVGLGDFFEAELLCADETGIELAKAQLDAFIADLALPALSIVQVGYVELWLRAHSPDVYSLGKYQVERTGSVSAPMPVDVLMQKRG